MAEAARPDETAESDGSVGLERVDAVRIPVGGSVSRDFTATVDLAPTASMDVAAITLAGTTSAEASLGMSDHPRDFTAGTLTAAGVNDLATSHGFSSFVAANGPVAGVDAFPDRWVGLGVLGPRNTASRPTVSSGRSRTLALMMTTPRRRTCSGRSSGMDGSQGSGAGCPRTGASTSSDGGDDGDSGGDGSGTEGGEGGSGSAEDDEGAGCSIGQCSDHALAALVLGIAFAGLGTRRRGDA